MMRWRYAGLALILAVLPAGCSSWRGQRSAAVKSDAPALVKLPRLPAFLSKNTSPPDYAPTLAIPGAADPPAAERQPALTLAALKQPEAPNNVETLPLSVPGESIVSDVPPLTAAAEESPLRVLYRRAQLKFESLNFYEMRLRRREMVGGKARPEELMQARFRREPHSVYLQWIGPEAKGREAVYVHGQHGGLIHTLTAKDDVPLIPAGTRFRIGPESPLVKSKSRYPITEAGLGALIARFGCLVDAIERGDSSQGTAKALGAFKRKEFEDKIEGVLQAIAPGAEALLPGGGQRLWCFDIEHGLPVLIVTYDEQHREVEYYCHDRFVFPAFLDDDAFDPDKLWKN